MKKSGRIGLTVLAFALLTAAGCIKQEDSYKISGSVILHENSAGAAASVKIYRTENFPGVLEQYKAAYPQTGAELSQAWYFDHRRHNPVKTGGCSSDGSFELDGLEEGYYILAALAEGFGWIYSEEFYLKSNKKLGTFNLYPETSVNALMEQDQTWSSGRHYLITVPVTVYQGVKLTIEPGVWIRLAGSSAKLTVLGEIQAEGTSEAWIRFTTAEESGEPVSWWKILLSEDTDTSSFFHYVLIEYALNGISLNNGKTRMEETVLREASNGISILTNSSTEINHCLVYDCYVGIDVSSTIELEASVIFNCTSSGVTVSQHNGTITGSIISGCGTGIGENYVDNLHINHCLIENNTLGLYYEAGAEGHMTLSYSNIVGNTERGLFCRVDAYPAISYCNIDNDSMNICLEGQPSGSEYLQSGNIDAFNCYWGTTDIEEIHSTIYDGFTAGSHPLLGEVHFQPFALEEIIGAGP